MGQPVRDVLPNNMTERLTPGSSLMDDKILEYKIKRRRDEKDQ
jgi:hypothetical protein